MAVLRNGKNSFLDIVTPVILKKILKNMNTMHMRFLKGYIRDILKIQKQIERNLEFFNSINGVDEIYLFGLSFGDVDAPYFRHVFKICQQLKTINLNVFEAGQYDSIMTKLKEYGAKCDIKKWIVE